MKNFNRGLFFFTSLLSVFLLVFSMTGCGPRPEGALPFNADSARVHVIPITEAREYARYFRETRDSYYARIPALKDSLSFGNAEGFNRDAILLLLNQKDAEGRPAAGIRIYYGLDKKGLSHQVLLPYDRKGNDIVNQLLDEGAKPGSGATQKLLLLPGQGVENGQRCPTICDGGNSGMSGL